MNNFNKSRFLAYGKWDWTINRSLYRNAAIVILAIILGATVLIFFGHFLMGQLMEEVNDISVLQVHSRIITITKWSMAIMSGYLFHNMLVKKTQIMELILPANVKEKFWWHVAVNIGGTFLVCIIGYILSDILLALLTTIFVGSEHVHSLIAFAFTFDVPSIMEEMKVAMNIGDLSNSSKNADQIMIDIISDFLNTIVFCSTIFQFATITFWTGLFSYVNSRKYRHNIPLTIIIMIGLGFVMCCIAIIAVFVYITNSDLEMGSIELAISIVSNLKMWVFALFSTELIAGILLWMGTYKGYKKAQLLKTDKQ